MMKTTLETILFSFFLYGLLPFCNALPLSTNNKWIVDAMTGQRVKLACVNWPSHLEPMLTEGLDHKPLKYLARLLAKQQFTCVRLTWSTFMFTRPDYGNKTVAQTFDSLNLSQAKAGIAKNNPFLLDMTHVQAYQAVVDELGRNGLMVVADNHISKPTWCCSNNDGNGFFGDVYFDPDEWLQGLRTVATLFKDKAQVIAIGLRNELRGSSQNIESWYKYISLGAMEIHKANPDLLVFASGLSYATDLRFLNQRPLGVSIGNKLVYEAHWYPWSWLQEDSWQVKPLNKVCPDTIQLFINESGFVHTGNSSFPLFLGEFGVNQKSMTVSEDHFVSCILDYITDQDLDWGLWAWQGSYYFRQNVTNMEETFGGLDMSWNRIRNPTFQNRLQLIKRKNQDPTSKLATSYVLFHPQSGSCIGANGNKEVSAIECKRMGQWNNDGDGSPIKLKDTNLCLKVVGDGISPILSTDCSSQQSLWTRLSESKLLLAAKSDLGEYLCLHYQKKSPQSFRILTRKCVCIQDEPACHSDPQKDPTVQWFKLVATNVG